MYCFGVDIGGTTIKMGLFQKDGTIIDKWEIKTRTENGGEEILPDIAASIEAKMVEHKIPKEELKGVGAGIPAPVSEEGIVQKTANLGWGYKNVKCELEELVKVPVRIGNDANVAALGEMWKGGGKGHKNVLMVTLGTGVGGGIIVNEQILTGANGAGGELGHVCVNPHETIPCGCGCFGCLEQYSSATGIVRLAKEKLAVTDKATILNAETVTAKDVFDAVKAGDEVADEIAVTFGTYLGRALRNMAVILDPTVIVIGGGVSKAGEVLLDYIKKPYMENVFFVNDKVEFVLAELGNDAGICGAARMVLD